MIIYVIQKKLRVTRILQFSQRNGKLPLQQLKQGNYPVIPIYAQGTCGTDIWGMTKRRGCQGRDNPKFSGSAEGWNVAYVEQAWYGG